MVISINRVTILGRVGADPERKGSGDGFAIMRVATSRTWKDRDGNRQEKTEWHNVTVFNQHAAKFVLAYVKKGDLVHVEGCLETSEYEKNGERRFSTNVVVNPYDGGVQSISNQPRDDDRRDDRTDDRRDDRRERQSESRSSRDLDDEIPF